MLYIILAILSGVVLLVIFKFFPGLGINTLAAIIFNYLTAAFTGFIFLEGRFPVNHIIEAPWLKLCVPLGALFLGVFYLISLTTQKMSISTASIANKMSVVMPVLFSVIFLGQELLWYRIAGIILALFAVYLSAKGPANGPVVNKTLWLPVLVFIGSGFIDISINAGNAYYVKTKTDAALFSIFTFFSAFCFGLCVIGYRLFAKKVTFTELFALKNILGGIALGIPNYFSIYFIFKALDTHILTSARLFPVLNVSNVALSALIGLLFFREKLSVVNLLGILLAVISILLITL